MSHPSSFVGRVTSKRLNKLTLFHCFLRIYVLLDVTIQPFYCVNTSYPMDNMLNRSAQTGPPNVRKRRPVFPPAGRSPHSTRQVACRTSFLSRQADVIASFLFGTCTACTDFLSWKYIFIFYEFVIVLCFGTLIFVSPTRSGDTMDSSSSSSAPSSASAEISC